MREEIRQVVTKNDVIEYPEKSKIYHISFTSVSHESGEKFKNEKFSSEASLQP